MVTVGQSNGRWDFAAGCGVRRTEWSVGRPLRRSDEEAASGVRKASMVGGLERGDLEPSSSFLGGFRWQDGSISPPSFLKAELVDFPGGMTGERA